MLVLLDLPDYKQVVVNTDYLISAEQLPNGNTLVRMTNDEYEAAAALSTVWDKLRAVQARPNPPVQAKG